MMHAHQELTLEDVLNEIVQNGDEPTHANLVRAIEDYPHYSAELTAFFAAWAVQADDDALAAPAEGRAAQSVVARGVSHALNLLHAKMNDEAGTAQSVGADGERLLALIRDVGLDEASFAAECGLDEGIIIKLDRRRIRPVGDIPSLCFERMTRVLVKHGVASGRALAPGRGSYDTLAPYVIASVTGNPLPMSAGAHLKSKTPPVIKTESFADAITGSTLSEDDKKSWLLLTKQSPP